MIPGQGSGYRVPGQSYRVQRELAPATARANRAQPLYRGVPLHRRGCV